MQKPSLSGDLSVSKLRHNVNRGGDVPVGRCSVANQLPASVGEVPQDLDGGGAMDGTAHLVSDRLSPTVSLQQPSYFKSDSLRSTDSDILSDDLSPPAKHKMVAIDISQNRQFSQKLFPVQSPEFDNVMDQVSVCDTSVLC